MLNWVLIISMAGSGLWYEYGRFDHPDICVTMLDSIRTEQVRAKCVPAQKWDKDYHS